MVLYFAIKKFMSTCFLITWLISVGATLFWPVVEETTGTCLSLLNMNITTRSRPSTLLGSSVFIFPQVMSNLIQSYHSVTFYLWKPLLFTWVYVYCHGNSSIRNKHLRGGRASSVKVTHLLGTHEDPRLISSTPWKARCGSVCWGDRDKDLPYIHQPENLTESASPRPVGHLALWKQGG